MTQIPTDHAAERIQSAPLPNARTLRARRSIPIQLWRFATINLRMLRMIRKGH
jgi:hypothetical protein